MERKQFNRNSKCPVSHLCGGCEFIDVPYTKQLMDKQEQLATLLKDYVQPEPIIGMTEPYHYRNKVNAAFGRDRNGNYISGIYDQIDLMRLEQLKRIFQDTAGTGIRCDVRITHDSCPENRFGK